LGKPDRVASSVISNDDAAEYAGTGIAESHMGEINEI